MLLVTSGFGDPQVKVTTKGRWWHNVFTNICVILLNLRPNSALIVEKSGLKPVHPSILLNLSNISFLKICAIIHVYILPECDHAIARDFFAASISAAGRCNFSAYPCDSKEDADNVCQFSSFIFDAFHLLGSL